MSGSQLKLPSRVIDNMQDLKVPNFKTTATMARLQYTLGVSAAEDSMLVWEGQSSCQTTRSDLQLIGGIWPIPPLGHPLYTLG